MSKASNKRKTLHLQHSHNNNPSKVSTKHYRSRANRAIKANDKPNAKLASADSRHGASKLDKKPAASSLREAFSRRTSGHRPPISEISREATAGGVIYRFNDHGGLEILLVADHFNRWTIPKGHIEEGETAQETAIREIGEEAGVHQLEPICWLGKIHFRYRRDDILVLMSTQIYLFRALGDTDDIQKEDWMNGIKWFSYEEAVDIIAYRDIAKLMRLGYRRLQQKGEID